MLITLLAICPWWLRNALAHGYAALASRWGTRAAQTSVSNLTACYPELSQQERRKLARSTMVHAALLVFETAAAWRTSPARALTWIAEVEGGGAVDTARRNGSPVLFLLPHLGNWELINHYLGSQYQLTHMYQPHRSEVFNRFVQTRRARTGTRFVPARLTGVRAQLRTLASGGCIGTMADQEPNAHEGTFAPLFGLKAWTGTLAPRLAHRTGAAVFVAWCERRDDGRFNIRFQPHGDCEPSAASFNLLIEKAVRSVPTQYLWSYKRFRSQPAGASPFYPSLNIPFGRVRLEVARFACHLAGRLPTNWLLPAARTVGWAMWITRTRFRRQSLINTRLCLGDEAAQDVALGSWLHTTSNVASTVKIWTCPELEQRGDIDTVIANAIRNEEGRGTLLLTPRLGHRELLVRAASQALTSSEIYKPFPRPTIDALLRERRAAWGIRLLPYTKDGFDTAKARLMAGECVQICPEQQPRRADGVFVDFFGEPALMPTGIAALATYSGCRVLLASAMPAEDSWQPRIEVLDLPNDARGILHGINAALERAILAAPAYFRWHDKRFNIRPRGARRMY